MTVESPCVKVCQMHPIYRCCRGCYRTALELRMWDHINDISKERILKGLAIKKRIYGDLKESVT